ncbi:MAG: tRNA (cytosine(32)/uridine(32)-2'-O)-methyltransferase TrmJ [Thermoplasmata archaeon HGW-Thermoplasmata-1]|nr:MAG: tRNA (cytosine(32)/uridine(32)-2'-O)-methyltransferase TrmJ [Thermoplasmata archaeon HGW-Thermoplasmata-1]
MPEFTVILVEPQHPGNVGAIARSMQNFDVSRLVLVNPIDINSKECRDRAVHAQAVLDEAVVVKSFKEAADRVDYLVATSARTSVNEKHHIRNPVPVREFAEKIYDLNGRVGIVFGREDAGLLNDEVAACDSLIRIPTSADYTSLNLSHAVHTVLYELFYGKDEKAFMTPRKTGKTEKDKLFEHFDLLLDSIRYPDHKKQITKVMFRRLIGRAMPSEWEYHTLMGVIQGALKGMGIFKQVKESDEEFEIPYEVALEMQRLGL